MRHYIWHKDQRIFGYSFNPLDGWVGRDMTDPASEDPEIVDLRNLYLSQDGCDGVVAYDCPCPAVHPDCTCCHDRVMDSYVDGGVLASKRDGPEMNLDGAAIAHLAEVSKPASTTVPFKLVDAGAPDGYTVNVSDLHPDISVVPGRAATLTFAAGETNSVNLTVPAALVRASVLVEGVRFKTQGFYVVGA